MYSCLSYVSWNGKSSTAYRTGDIYCMTVPTSGFIDVSRTSPNGKLYFNTENLEFCNGNQTAIYKYDPKAGGVTPQISNLLWTEGFCFDPCTSTFYLTDNCKSVVSAYYWNPTSGSLGKQNKN